MRIAMEKGSAGQPNLVCGICGEHGGDRNPFYCAQARWTTFPAPPSGCRSRAWRPPTPRSRSVRSNQPDAVGVRPIPFAPLTKRTLDRNDSDSRLLGFTVCGFTFTVEKDENQLNR